jgi:hypothetical protein
MSSAPVAQTPAGGASEGEQRQQSPFQSLASLVLRMGVMYAFMMFMKGGKKDTDAGVVDSKGSLLTTNTASSATESDHPEILID